MDFNLTSKNFPLLLVVSLIVGAVLYVIVAVKVGKRRESGHKRIEPENYRSFLEEASEVMRGAQVWSG